MFTEIVMVLDRSGSMGWIKESTIEGVNDFIKEQKKLEGKCNFTLRQFDTEHTKTFDNKSMDEVGYLDNRTFQPRGATALYDAICLAINETGDRLANLDKANRPDNVMFVIMTDGQENSSREFTKQDVNDKITHQTEKYEWDFIFLAANQDAIATGASFGIDKGKSMTFSASASGMGNSMASVNLYYSSVRSGDVGASAANFSEEDRTSAMED